MHRHRYPKHELPTCHAILHTKRRLRVLYGPDLTRVTRFGPEAGGAEKKPQKGWCHALYQPEIIDQ